MKQIKSYKFIDIIELDQVNNRKTRDYEIKTKYGDCIGRVSFYSSWRQHVLIPGIQTIWSAGCLADVQDVMKLIKEKKV